MNAHNTYYVKIYPRVDGTSCPLVKQTSLGEPRIERDSVNDPTFQLVTADRGPDFVVFVLLATQQRLFLA